MFDQRINIGADALYLSRTLRGRSENLRHMWLAYRLISKKLVKNCFSLNVFSEFTLYMYLFACKGKFCPCPFFLTQVEYVIVYA